MNILQLLDADNFVKYNVPLAVQIGLHSSILFSQLVEEFRMVEKNTFTFGNNSDWFPLTLAQIEYLTVMKKNRISSSIKKLKNLGFIQVKIFEMPGRRFFRINKEFLNGEFHA